jgi:signal transduction histidine kinase
MQRVKNSSRLASAACCFRVWLSSLSLALQFAAAAFIVLAAAMTRGRPSLPLSKKNVFIDSGPGTEMNSKPSQSALGFADLRDRIESLGGQFEIKTAPGVGTRIVSRFVLNKDALSHV